MTSSLVVSAPACRKNRRPESLAGKSDEEKRRGPPYNKAYIVYSPRNRKNINYQLTIVNIKLLFSNDEVYRNEKLCRKCFSLARDV